MPLILAVEPDRRQAANLAAVLRLRPRMELVIANAAAPALEALGDRVPAVLLTSTLLSQHDDAVLSAWMAALGPAADHVQALTIPILATDLPPPPRKRGVFSRLRRQPAAATLDGCQPSDFAEQVGMYLQRAEPEAPIEELPAPVVEEIPVPEEIPIVEDIPVPVVEQQPLSLAAVRLGFADRLRAMATPSDPLAILALPALSMATSRLSAELDEWRLQLLARPEPVPAAQPAEEPWVELPPEAFPEAQDEVWVLRVTPELLEPIQDEWGFFDPSQCGFSALIAKLDEIAEHEDAEDSTTETSVRVISSY